MPIDLYYLPRSPPCVSVRLLAETLDIDLNLIYVDLMKKEHLTPEYLKINPQHTVPTLVDDGFSLWESRAILIYLIEKYGADSPLYPKCPQARAAVHQRLDFDLGTLYPRFIQYFAPQISGNEPADPEKLTKVHDALDFLNTFLDGQTYAAGDELTIADYALFVSVLTFEVASIDLEKHENVSKWFAACKEAIGQSDIVEEHVNGFQGIIDNAKE